jgi:L-fuculose-phosphate aldolase
MTFLSLNSLSHTPLRRDVITTALRMNAAGINHGKSGNVSTRVLPPGGQTEGFLITPTGIDYDAIQPEQIVLMDMQGEHAGDVLPSSEWRFHRDIYAARPDVAAIVHTHSIFATTLACQHRNIPPFHYMVAMAGGRDIRCAPYATFGTQALSDAALSALEGRRACLLAQHGVIACGESLKAALALAIEIEALATMYWHALQLGEPPHLSNAEMEVVLDKFKTYGQQPTA